MRHFLVSLFCGLALVCSAAVHAKPPLKVCLLSGCDTYHSEKSLPPFQKFLDANYNVQCTRIVRQGDELPGLDQLEDCDVALVFIKRMPLQGEQLKRFQEYMTSGKPIVAVRTASHAVQTWLEFDPQVLGGNYHGHYPVGLVTKIETTAAGEKHPILKGVQLKTAGDALYKNDGHADDIQVLLRGTIPNQPTEPLAWTREYKGGRVFYTSLGAEDTFEKPDFRRMLANALFWTAKRDVDTNTP